MPRRFERHKRTKWEWGLPARSAEVQEAARADPDPAKRAPARKDTRSWCKGKVGVGHAPELVLSPPVLTRWACEWSPGLWSSEDGSFPVKWRCCHREICQRCSKVLREPWELKRAECPAYPGSGEQHAAAEAEAEKMSERHRAWWGRRRPAITGPQGYRRRREGM